MLFFYFSTPARVAIFTLCHGISYCLLLILLFSIPQGMAATLSLEEARRQALKNDPVLAGSELREQAYQSDAVAADTWDAPVLSSSIQNLPTDSFSLNQEPMTQLQIGIKQALPRGNTARLKAEGAQTEANKEQVIRNARKARVIQQVSIAWYQGYFAQYKLALLDEKEALVSQLIDTIQAAYSSGDVSSQQQDIVSLTLDKVMINDAQTRAKEEAAAARGALLEWLDRSMVNSLRWPKAEQLNLAAEAMDYANKIDNIDVVSLMAFHPEAIAYEFDEKLASTQLAIAKEQTKAKWALQASYGYRHTDGINQQRADFISFGVQVDLPSLSATRQNADIASQASRLSAVATDRRVAIKRLASQAQQYQVRLVYGAQRHTLLKQSLLTQAEYAEAASLRTFAQGNGKMAQVLGARLSTIDAKLAMLDIESQLATSLQQVNYFYQPALTLYTRHQGGN